MRKLIAIGIIGLASSLVALAKPTVGGNLIYGRSGDAVSLDPGKETDGESFDVTINIFDNLVRFKRGSTEIEPSLAESWQISPNHLEYTFKLRKGVKFHDGTDFNADAVLFSYLRQHDPKHEAYKYANAWDYWTDMALDKNVAAIEKVDDFTVLIKLNKPESPFLANLAMPFAAIVSPTAVRKHKQEFAKKPVGTGPFKFVSWARGERIILDANTSYWDGRPYVNRVIFRTISDDSARLNSFLAKEIHIMNLPRPEHIATIKSKRPDAKIIEENAMNVAYLAFNTSKPPFDNVKVRQALSMAVNKEAIVKGIYSGMATAAKNPMPPIIWGYNDSIQDYKFDVEKAKKLLAEAGFPKGFKAELFTLPIARAYMADGKKVGEAIQSNLKAIGVDINLTTMEWGTYLEKTKGGHYQMAILGWIGDNGDPDNFLYVLLSGANTKAPASNIALYKNAQVDKLLSDAKSLTSQSERAELYKKAQVLIHQDAPWIPLAHSKVVVPTDKRVNDFVIDPTGVRRFSKIWLSK